MCRLLDKVEEMASVMQRAVRLDDQETLKIEEKIARLEMENQTLRQLLQVPSLSLFLFLSQHSPLIAGSIFTSVSFIAFPFYLFIFLHTSAVRF